MLDSIVSETLLAISDYEADRPDEYAEFRQEIRAAEEALQALLARLDNHLPEVVSGLPDANGWIRLATGEVTSPAYRGSVDLYIGSEYESHLDLLACYDERHPGDQTHLPANDPVFRGEVIRVLSEAAKLPVEGDFDLLPADPDEQQEGDAVFASLTRNGRDVSEMFAELWGAVPGDGSEVPCVGMRVE